ncbi:S-locus glycoprotein [Trema orientale]|uniref:S-locus glycoprotein n=1 Tax=Trema orientale TaxID=63057 RepID=A0A2P5E9S9_TREOI|nr:S-locus glycoprotein [Trema orientale]
MVASTLVFMSISAILLSFLSSMVFAADSLRPPESIKDGGTLVSSDGSFELGFFSPGISKNRYLGIWYKNIPVQTVVWVANRCNPIIDMSGLLTLNSSGNLVLLGHNKTVVWSSSSSSSKQAQKPILQLLDTGNLVVGDEKDNGVVMYSWQSFDYPSDTGLPGMKTGFNLKTGFKWVLSAWRNPDDPCPDDYTFSLESHTNPELYITEGKTKMYRSGPWNGIRFSGVPELTTNQLFDFQFVYNEDEAYYMYNLRNKSVVSRIVLNETTGTRQRLTWIEADQTWRLYSATPRDYCDDYGICGANGNCIITENPPCQCLQGFKPKYQEKWNSMDWSDGCVRDDPLHCGEKYKDGFVKFSGLKLPEATNSSVDKSMSLKECGAKCLSNCSCMAYINSDIRGEGSGCVMWFGDLLDIRQVPNGGEDLHIRMPASQLGKDLIFDIIKARTKYLVDVEANFLFSCII